MPTSYVSFTYVDATTGVPVTQAPAEHLEMPEGCVFEFALESRYPTTEPVFFGTTEGATNISGILQVYTKTEYEAARAKEMLDRQPPRTTVGTLVSRFLVPAEAEVFADLDDAMNAESRLVRRNWNNDSYEFSNGDSFWLIVSGYLDGLVTPERKAEILPA